MARASSSQGAYWSVGEADLCSAAFGIQRSEDESGCTGGQREGGGTQLCLWRAREGSKRTADS